MKKVFAIMLFAAVIGTEAFAQELSAGLFVLPNFGGAIDSDLKTTYGGFGFGAYFDAKYVVANLGFNFITETGTLDLYGAKIDYSADIDYFTFGLLGKYPIDIGGSFSIAPALGFEYQSPTTSIVTSRKFDNFIIKFGALADYKITDALYARAGVLLDFRLAHKDSNPADTNLGVEIPIGIGYRFK